jgi:4-hydroxybenzoate polyprenyltransferase
MLNPGIAAGTLAVNVLIGFASACLSASANYVINEWLDAEYDRHHPLKLVRPAAAGRLHRTVVYLEYVVLAAVSLALASLVGSLFLAASAVFLISGIAYNVMPLRTKDRVYLDVVSEAVNNPIRLVLGWAMVSSTTVPPLSLFGAFWMSGAFLMAAKRLSEYKFIADRTGAGMYRRSFRYYTVETLTISCFTYAILAAFFIAVFLIKYREEYVLSFPLIALLFGYYLHLALQPASIAQRPETLHNDRRLLVILAILTTVIGVLSFIDLPSLRDLIRSTFLEIHLG